MQLDTDSQKALEDFLYKVDTKISIATEHCTTADAQGQ